MQSRFAEEVRESAVKANEEQVAASFEWASEREAYLSAEAKAGSLRRTLLREVDSYRAEALIQVGLKNEFQMEKESACAARNALTQELGEQRRLAAADLLSVTLRLAKGELVEHTSTDGGTSCDAP